MSNNAGHGTEEHLAGDGIELTDDESQILRRARIAKSAANAIGQADIIGEVRRLDPREKSSLQRQLKLRAGAPLPALALAVRSGLARAEEERAAWILHDSCHRPVLETALTCGLTEGELAAVLSADPDELTRSLESLSETGLYDILLDVENFGSTSVVRAAAWSAMAAVRHSGSVAALAWLLADPPTFWSTSQTEPALAVWRSVRERYPLLPETPASLATLIEVISTIDEPGLDVHTAPSVETNVAEGTGLFGSTATSGLEAIASPAEGPRPDTTQARHSGYTADMLAGLCGEGERVELERQAIAADVLPTLTRSIETGVSTDTADIARLTSFHASLSALLGASESLNGGQPVRSLEQARGVIARARNAASDVEAAAERIRQVRRLVTLTGPAFLANDIAEVQSLAADATAETDSNTVGGLASLLELIELAGSDLQRAAELGRIVSTSVSAATSLLMFTNTAGTFTVGDAAYDPPAGRTAVGPDAEEERADTDEVAYDGPQAAPDTAPPNLVEPTAADDTAGGEVPAGDDQPIQLITRSSTEVSATDVHGGGLNAAEPAPAQPEPGIDDVLSTLKFTIPVRATQRPADPAPGSVPEMSTGRIDQQPELDPIALYSELLRSGELSLAYWLTFAENADGSIQAAHRLAALAGAMKSSAGSNAAAFAATIANLHPDAIKDRPDTQMLVYGAAVRAGLLSPIAGASDLLREATPSVVRSGSAVGELTECLLAAIYAGVFLTPRSADAVIEAAEAESEHEALASAAARMLESAPNRTIRHGPAADLWQNWMTPEEGYLGRPLSIVASGSLSAVDLTFIRARIADLRSPRSLEQALDRSTSLARGGKRTAKRIESWSRNKLIEWTGDVTELLTQWVTATEDLSPRDDGAWMTDPIADLRAKVAAVREQALAELRQMCETGSEPRDAASEAGLKLLTNALDLLLGTASVAGVEIPADRALGGLLLLAPDVELTASMEPRSPLKVKDIAGAFSGLRNGDRGWSTAFDVRAERHDQIGTQLLIETLRPLRPQLAKTMSAARDRAVDASIALVNLHHSTLAARIDSDRRFGRLGVDEWTDLSTRARAYEPGLRGTRSDFDVMLDNLGAIETIRAKLVKAAIATAREKLDTAGIPDGAVDRIQRRIDDGDLTTAAEYVVTVRSGGQLPGPRDEIDHLTRFYRALPDAFAANGPGVGAGNESMLVQLRGALESSTSTGALPPGALADALIASGIELEMVGRGKTAGARIEQWMLLGQSRSFGARISNVKSVLEQVGFVFDKSTNPPARRGDSGGRGSWLDLYGVRATSGKALLPAFGSGMSPSGDSLRLLAVWRAPTPRELVEILREEPNDHSIVVLYFGTLDSAARRELARAFRSDRRLPTSVVIDDAAFAYLSCQPEPSREITMSALLPFTSSSPFTPDVPGASIRQEMFYGRSDERAKIIDMMGPCIVYGGRQLGKSALLIDAARKFDDKRKRHAIYESIFKIGRAVPVDAVWTTLWPLLAARDIVPTDIPAGNVAEALTGYVTRWISARPGRQLLLLLDESDEFLDGDAEAVNGMFTHVTHFKELMERTRRAVKVVFAGLHQTARFDRLANHPLAHFGEPVCVGPLASQAAYDLLTRPLDALGYRFDESDHAARVLALANNQPALIQLFAAQLLRNLQSDQMPADALPQTVHVDDVERVWADQGLRTSFRKRFDWTLELDPRYKIIAYSVALNAHAHGIETTMTPSELRVECETWWPAGFSAEDVRTGEFRALLDECVDLGVLSYTNLGYRLRTPNVLDLLGTSEEVDAVLDQAESIELPESFDGSMMRPVFGNGPTRGPLTSQQIADLLAARSQVRMIVGSYALTAERCLKALQDENGHAVSGHREAALREATPTTLVKVCQQVTLKAAGRHAIVIVDLKNAAPADATAVWTQSRELIATHSGGTLGIVLVSTPMQAPMWPAAAREADTSSGLTELRRYDRTDLRLWLTETTLPFQDNAARDELLAVTGGWPIQLNKVAEDLTRHDPGSRSDPLTAVRPNLMDIDDARRLVEASGVRADLTLSQAWDFLVRTVADERVDPETLVEYLTLAGESGEDASDALTELAVNGAGYADYVDVSTVLRILGVVVGVPDDGLCRLEPVLLSATRRVQG